MDKDQPFEELLEKAEAGDHRAKSRVSAWKHVIFEIILKLWILSYYEMIQQCKNGYKMLTIYYEKI